MVTLPEASKAKMFAKCVFRINLALFSLLEKIELPLHTNERKARANRFKYKRTHDTNVSVADHQPK